MVGWYHRLNGDEFEKILGVGDGQRGLVCCSPWGRKQLDTTDQLNRTELTEKLPMVSKRASQVAQWLKNPPTDTGDTGSIPGSGRTPGRGNGNLLQHSCLKNPMERGSGQVTVHGVTKS